MHYPKVLERVDFPEQIFHRSFSLGAPERECPEFQTNELRIVANRCRKERDYWLCCDTSYKYHISKKKIQNFRLKVKWNRNFPEDLFGNCRQSPEVVLFFHSEWSGGNFITICFIFQFSVSHQPETIARNRIANGKRHLGRLICWFWKNPYHYSMVTH